MPLPPPTALNDLFSDDVDEIIERVLVRYRPIFSHVVMRTLRSELQRAIDGNPSLKPWLPASPFEPVRGAGPLTAAQVALLGGTRPTRTLHTLAHRLSLPLDGGDKEGQNAAELLLHQTDDALDSVIDHHDVTPVKGREAGLRRLRELVRMCLAAQIAAIVGTLRAHHDRGRRYGDGEEPEIIRRYFLGVLHAFSRIKLSKRDQEVFRDHYLDARDIEELADENGRGLDAEAARRIGFLKRFATAFEAAVDAIAREGHDGTAGAPSALAGAEGGGEAGARGARALNPATVRGGRPRKR